MKTTPTKPRRFRSLIVWVTVLALAFFVGVPTVFALRARYRLESAIVPAASIRLEEFQSDSVLTSRKLESTDVRAVLQALPPLPDAGVPGLMAFCYRPHHRIIVSDISGATQCTLSVCFGCEQFAFVGYSDVAPTPFAWRQPLRRLFTEHGIPIQSAYSDVSDIHSN